MDSINSEGGPPDLNFSIAGTETQAILEDCYELPCQFLEESELSQYPEVEVTLSDPEKGRSFLLTTSPPQWVVRRTIDDFHWLRNLLVQSYPGVYVAPTIPKRMKGNKKEGVIHKHMVFAEKFLHSLLRHSVLRRSPFVIGFLKSETKESFDIFKKHASKSKPPDTLSEFITHDGIAHCDPNRNVGLTKKYYDYLSSSYVLHRTLKRQSERLEHDLTDAAETVGKICESLQQLARLQEMVPQNDFAKDVINVIEQATADWSTDFLDKANATRVCLSDLFKYTYHEVVPMIDLLKTKEQHFKVFFKAHTKLETKKEKLWVQGDPAKWEIDHRASFQDDQQSRQNKQLAFQHMLAKQTQKVNHLRDVHAFFNYKLTEELKLLCDYKLARNLSCFLRLTRQGTDHCETMSKVWATCAERLKTLDPNFSG